MTDSELYHYGVKGMKWGRRRGRSNSSSSSSSSSSERSVKDIPDEELKKMVARLQLEKQYTQLMSEPGTKAQTTKGKNHAKQVMTGLKTANELYNLANGPMAKSVKKVVLSEMGKRNKAPALSR